MAHGDNHPGHRRDSITSPHRLRPYRSLRLTVRLKREDVERMMEQRPAGSTLEEALEVFEVFASGTLADEVYVLDDVSGKRIAIAPATLKAKYRKE